MITIKRILVIVWLGVVVSCFGCAGAQHNRTGESLRPGYEVAYRPVYQPEWQWNDLLAAYNARLKDGPFMSDRRYNNSGVWMAMKSDDLAHSPLFIRNLDFADNRVDFTYIQTVNGFNVGSNKIFSMFYYQLMKANIVVEFATEGVIDGYAMFIPGVVSFRARNFDIMSKLADIILIKQTKLREYVEGLEKQFALFEPVAAQYLALTVKPQMSEEQRRLIVQANVLTQQKNYTEAMEQYVKAITLDPTSYPSAYYNLALLQAQENGPVTAIFNMKRYLMLVPDAKDARSARDKIYEWEYLYLKK